MKFSTKTIISSTAAATIIASSAVTTTNAFVLGGPNNPHRPAFITGLSSQSVLKAPTALRSTVQGASSSSSSSQTSSELVEEAMRITKQYGARSMEARLAWETVEEVRAADNSEATKGSMIDHCFVDLDAAACDEFSTRMNELKRLIEATEPIMSVDSRVEQVPDVNLAASTTTTTSTTVNNDNDIQDARNVLKAAIEEAEQATNDHGIRSSNAQVAWDHVEEIAAAIGHLHAQ